MCARLLLLCFSTLVAAAAEDMLGGVCQADVCTHETGKIKTLPTSSASLAALLAGHRQPEIFTLENRLLGDDHDAASILGRIGRILVRRRAHVVVGQHEHEPSPFPFFSEGSALEGLPSRRMVRRDGDITAASGGLELLTKKIRDQVIYSSGPLFVAKPGSTNVSQTFHPLADDLIAATDVLSGIMRAAAASVPAREVRANIWASSAGATTPLHYDERSNLFFQLQGRKRIRLYAPTIANMEAARLFPRQSPGARQASKHGGELRLTAVYELDATRALLIPPYYLHSVETLGSVDDQSISVSVWVDSAARADVAAGLRRLVRPNSTRWSISERLGVALGLLRQLEEHTKTTSGLARTLSSRFDGLYGSEDASTGAVLTAAERQQLCGTSFATVMRRASSPGSVLLLAADQFIREASDLLGAAEPASLRPLLLGDLAESMVVEAFSPRPSTFPKLRHMVPLVARNCFDWEKRNSTNALL